RSLCWRANKSGYPDDNSRNYQYSAGLHWILCDIKYKQLRHYLTNYAPDCVSRLGECDPRLVATVVEKPASTAPQAWCQTLDRAINVLSSHPDYDHAQLLGVPLVALQSEFFRLSRADLQALGEEARDELETQVSLELHSHLLPMWEACAEDWVMLQRVDESILVVDRGNDDALPSIDAVRSLEAERDSAALVMGRPTVLEEGPALVHCTPPQKDWRRYPFVQLIVGTDKRDFHLDTGNPESFISHEFLKRCVAVPTLTPKRTIVTDLRGNQDAQAQIPVDVDLHVSGSRGNVALSLRLQAVKNWHGARLLNPSCSGQRCPQSSDGQCGRRLGLMGRDMLYAFDRGVWQFDPQTGQFYAVSTGG
ncbi:MAG: hypothetical protein ACLQQB_01140, partial [Solirubrobacteraceae bacterium]